MGKDTINKLQQRLLDLSSDIIKKGSYTLLSAVVGLLILYFQVHDTTVRNELLHITIIIVILWIVFVGLFFYLRHSLKMIDEDLSSEEESEKKESPALNEIKGSVKSAVGMLLVEYENTTKLVIQENQLSWTKIQNLIYMSSVLITLLLFALKFKIQVLAIFISSFGIAISVVFWQIQLESKDRHRRWVKRVEEIENATAKYDYGHILATFSGVGKAKKERKSINGLMINLNLTIIVGWILIFLYSFSLVLSPCIKVVLCCSA